MRYMEVDGFKKKTNGINGDHKETIGVNKRKAVEDP